MGKAVVILGIVVRVIEQLQQFMFKQGFRQSRAGLAVFLFCLLVPACLFAQETRDPMEALLERALRETMAPPADMHPDMQKSAARFSPPPNTTHTQVSTQTSKSSAPATAADSKTEDIAFSNACQPAQPAAATTVPKSLAVLKQQLGSGFRAVQRNKFLIGSDLPEEEFTLLVDGVLTCCHECLAKEYFSSTPLNNIVTIYVFRNEASYTYNLARLLSMQPISPYGHYGHREQYIVINYDTGPGTLVHELTHALMAPDFPQAPIWISEGIASLYEQCRVEGTSLRGDPNWRLPELKTALDNKNIPALKTLLALKPGDFRAKQESLHYAASRYFCKYMEEHNLLSTVYRTFRDKHADDPTGIRFVEKAFGKPLSAIEADWHTWLANESWQ